MRRSKMEAAAVGHCEEEEEEGCRSGRERRASGWR